MKVAVKGIGITKFGEHWDKTLEEIAIEAASKAISDAQLVTNQIDAVFVANMTYPNTAGQNHLGALVTSSLGINSPAFSNEAACSSGGIATHLAIQSLLSGQYENVLVVGAEKMTDVSGAQISLALMGAASAEERTAGLTFPALYALMAKAHMKQFGTTKEQLAAVAVKNHFHGSLNPLAQYPFEISIDKVLKSSMVASPLTLLDCSPITDGAAAIVLSRKVVQKNDVVITGSAVATDSLSLAKRDSLTELKATKIASQKALSQSGLTITEIDVAEVHDCFTIAEIIALEDLGFCKKGQGGNFTEKGKTKLGGKIPINTSGGLKSCGHPVGATGIKQIIEITNQLRGILEQRQVKNARVGLTHNVGGSGATVAIHILQKL